MTKAELLERLETLKTEQEAKACLGCHYIKPECEKTCVIIESAIKVIKSNEGEKHGCYMLDLDVDDVTPESGTIETTL